MCDIVWSKRWTATIHYKRFCDLKAEPLTREECEICKEIFLFYPGGKLCATTYSTEIVQF